LHENGSNNPLGNWKKAEPISFFPYFYVKDLLAFLILVLVFSFFVFQAPNDLGHTDNYIRANSLVTPAHIVPEWYFLPFYAILRSFPNKLGGVILMFLAIVALLLLPILDEDKVRCTNYRPFFRCVFWLFFVNFLILGWVGQQPADSPYIEVGMFATFYYFFSLAILLPGATFLENYLYTLATSNLTTIKLR